MSPQVDPSEQVLEALQDALKAELTAIHQYLLHSKMCKNWGYSRLAEYYRTEAGEEMGHAEALMDRILFLKATPNMDELSPVAHSSNVKEQFETDLALEREAISRLNAGIKLAVEANDNVSRQLFDEIAKDEDQHVDYLEGQLHVIEEIGLRNYLTQQIQK
jgi:bacterioferritin